MSAMKLTSPHPYPERILLFGGGGVGKTNSALSVAAIVAEGDMWVVEADYSGSYKRALATDFTDIEDRVHVTEVDPDWESFISAVQHAVEEGDPEVDWLVIDPCGNSYDWVQDWVMDQVHGGDMARMLIDLKKLHGNDAKGYAAARSNLMNWELVKKEYNKLWKAIQRWKGNLILVAEAKEIGSREDDVEVKMLFGPLGFKPAGHANMKHVASTTLFLDHPKRGQWRMTTIKDRNREEVDKADVEDFGMDYLLGIAGWVPAGKSGKGSGK